MVEVSSSRATDRAVSCILTRGGESIEVFRRHDDIYWRVQAVNEGAPGGPIYRELKSDQWRSLSSAERDVAAVRMP